MYHFVNQTNFISMKTQIHHGEKLRFLFAEKGMKAVEIAQIRQVKKQSISNDFNREKIGLNTLKEYCEVLGISLEDFFSEQKVNLSTQNKSKGEASYQEEYFKLLRTTNHLWNVINQYGIKVELPNFNFGELMPTYGTVFFGANNP